jgi:hypothetical protein
VNKAPWIDFFGMTAQGATNKSVTAGFKHSW